jgi:hypothetical protein
MRPCPRHAAQASRITWPTPWHAGHERDGEESLTVGNLPAAAACFAGGHARAGFRARSVTCFACFAPRNVNLRADARRGFFKREGHVVTQIGATLAALPTAPATPSATENILEAEEIAEYVLKILEDRRIESAGLESATAQASMAKAIVNCPFLRVRKHTVSFGCSAKIKLRFVLILRVAVRMPFHCRFSVRGLDLLRGRFARYFQHCVEVLLFAGCHSFF